MERIGEASRHVERPKTRTTAQSSTVAARAPMKHVVITGRNTPQALIGAADMVTGMNPVKHTFRAGAKPQARIEF